MKKLYWRPQRISRKVLALVAVIAVAGMLSVELFRVEERQPHYAEKIKAAKLARDAFSAIKAERLKRKIPLDKESDPTDSGMIGQLLSPATTSPGHLPAKQTSVNPNFAAVVVHMLKRAGLEEGDVVAVGFTGSFPAINVAVLAALETLKIRALVISSVGASQWGANNPEFLWTDMEETLVRQRVFSTRSIAMTLGGIDDLALGLSPVGIGKLRYAIQSSKVPELQFSSFEESVQRRVAAYVEHAGEAEVKAYINVGGGTASVGTHVGKKLFRPGLNRTPPPGAAAIDSVMSHFSIEGLPVIHMTKIDELAQRYGLPLQPERMPSVGEGKIFRREVYNQWLAWGVLIGILGMLWIFVRLDWGYRLFGARPKATIENRPQQTV